MKRFASRLIAIFLSVLLAGSALASCNKPGEKTPVTEKETIEHSGSLGGTTEKPNLEPIIEGPYRIDYLKDCPNVGNCTAQLVLNPSWTEDFTVEIPAYSPDGYLITHFSRWDTCFVDDCIPKIISEKTYQEAILKPLNEAAARGEMESFKVRMIDAFFQQKNPSEMRTDAEKEYCIRRYPITDPNGANIPIRVFAEDALSVEILMIQDYLSKYTSFSKDTVKADFAYLQDAIRKSSLNGTQKANLLLEYQYSENDHLVGLTLPDTLWGVQASDLIGFKDLIQTENGISYIGNWVIRVDSNLSSIVLRDGTVGIAEGAISNGNDNLESMTIPATLKTICGEIAGWDSSFRKLYISDLAAWCAVRCIRYSYSGLGSAFRVAHDLYLNGELLTDLVIPDGVTKIEDSAFEWCTNLKSLTIPASVTEIGSSAFNGCTGLTAVYISDLTAWCNLRLSYRMSPLWYAGNLYMNGTLLKDVIIPDGVTTIGPGVFAGCKLTSVIIPDSVTSIGAGAFSSCSSLTSITIPDSVTSIGGSVFSGCSSLTSIAIGKGVTSIVSSAFSGCNDLIQKDGGVWYVDKWVIGCDESVTNITLHNDTVGIGDSAFSDCNNLTSITIPDGVTSIGSGAFSYCSNLTSITIPDGVMSIGSYAFQGCSSLTSVTIPDSVTSIGNSAFSGCSSLSSITIPNSVTSIGYAAFSDCSSLTSITVPGSVTSIGERSFKSCRSLTSITIPDNVTYIGHYAFTNCSSLTKIIYNGTIAQWNAISKGSDWISWTAEYTVYCSDGEIKKQS